MRRFAAALAALFVAALTPIITAAPAHAVACTPYIDPLGGVWQRWMFPECGWGNITLQGTQVVAQSQNGQWVLRLESNGDLVERASWNGAIRWQAGVSGSGNKLNLMTNGNMAMLDSSNTVLWQSGATWPCTGFSLSIDGNGVMNEWCSTDIGYGIGPLWIL